MMNERPLVLGGAADPVALVVIAAFVVAAWVVVFGLADADAGAEVDIVFPVAFEIVVVPAAFVVIVAFEIVVVPDAFEIVITSAVPPLGSANVMLGTGFDGGGATGFAAGAVAGFVGAAFVCCTGAGVGAASAELAPSESTATSGSARDAPAPSSARRIDIAERLAHAIDVGKILGDTRARTSA